MQSAIRTPFLCLQGSVSSIYLGDNVKMSVILCRAIVCPIASACISKVAVTMCYASALILTFLQIHYPDGPFPFNGDCANVGDRFIAQINAIFGMVFACA